MDYIFVSDQNGNNLNLLPTPDKGSCITTYQDLYKTAKRNSQGILTMQFVRTICKVEIKYNLLDRNTFNNLISYLNNNPLGFYVTKTNPVNNSQETINMYSGDRKYNPYLIDASTGIPTYYQNITFNFIQI